MVLPTTGLICFLREGDSQANKYAPHATLMTSQFSENKITKRAPGTESQVQNELATTINHHAGTHADRGTPAQLPYRGLNRSDTKRIGRKLSKVNAATARLVRALRSEHTAPILVHCSERVFSIGEERG